MVRQSARQRRIRAANGEQYDVLNSLDKAVAPRLGK